jgi:hypothetical protein
MASGREWNGLWYAARGRFALNPGRGGCANSLHVLRQQVAVEQSKRFALEQWQFGTDYSAPTDHVHTQNDATPTGGGGGGTVGYPRSRVVNS